MSLQHRTCAVVEGGLGNERLGRVAKWATDNDGPLPLQAGDQRREFLKPLRGAGGERLVAHESAQS